MELKTEGIVLRATDYKENDKILTVLTPAYGKLTVGIRGVRKANSKLNFASQPFAFCEFVLAEKGGRYTVTSAYLYDGFFALRTDIVRYYCACALAETADALALEGTGEGLFVALAEGLKTLSLSDESPAEAYASFALVALREAGYMIGLDGCGVCGSKVEGKIYFDFDAGTFTCSSCAVGDRASESTYAFLRSAEGGYENGIKGGDGDIRSLRLINKYLSVKTEREYPCLTEFIRLFRNE